MKYFETKRLILRQWLKEDLEHVVKINQDTEVMKYFPSILERYQTEEFIEKVNKHFQRYGYGLYACILKEINQCIGFVGLCEVGFEAHFTPAVEIGWRLSSEYWNKGYATEAAKLVLDLAFNEFNLDRIVSFTATINKPSIRIMEKIGLNNDIRNNFDHPKLPKGHILKPHVLYSIDKSQYKKLNR